jgi:hypothetical protein
MLAAVALLLVACNDCNSTCKEGITFYVADLAGSLARGTTETLHICFDGTCREVVVGRQNTGGTVFLPFSGVGKAGDHQITVSGTGALKGQYNGPLASYSQKASCSTCSLASVKIGSGGELTPGVPVVKPTTTTRPSTTVAG